MGGCPPAPADDFFFFENPPPIKADASLGHPPKEASEKSETVIDTCVSRTKTTLVKDGRNSRQT